METIKIMIQKTRGQELLSDFYDLHKEYMISKSFDLEDKILSDLVKKYPEIKVFNCDNNYFASSLLLALPLSNSLVALIFINQFSDEIVQINFSSFRFEELKKGLNQIALPSKL